ncbi:asparagine synthase-domain-containing protein [Lactarius akahatsu]|uniref:Asparagine synthase-domain-containing protein n=1 Tax=Lactarius akahatsu TaxID=416441 RepID=A0AAD4LJV0_9AGAM|nr:asparagine synthase-domain-containing protein [Lactarius akahatsu]
MCGIVFLADWHATTANRSSRISDEGFIELMGRLRAASAARGQFYHPLFSGTCCTGPDVQRDHQITLKSDHGATVYLDFFASELRLRGDAPVAQPHIHESGNVLCWNGEVSRSFVHPEENDGSKLSAAMSELEDASAIVQLLGTLEGPYAFVYYHHRSGKVFFARDPLGRRSLLMHVPSPDLPYLLLASVSAGKSDHYDFTETQPDKVNQASPPTDTEDFRLQSLDIIPQYLSSAVDELTYHLDHSVSLRVRNVPQRGVELPSSDQALSARSVPARVAVLFSGGIDSTVCAFLAHKHIPLDEPIDLLNVAFENPRKIRGQVDGAVGGIKKKKQRAMSIENTVSIDEQLSAQYNPDYLVPDRVTGLSELEELRRLCPGRRWNFVEVDVPYTEYQDVQETVESVMWPCQTVMDLSISMPLYFAACGVGKVRRSVTAEPQLYTSSARVLLNGLGSDELLGGYSRHRTVYNTGGWKALIDELQLDMDRIPTRNLGRDDRVISAHGRETRHPFLSLDVVNFLVALPIHIKTDPRLEVGVGDKMLLRLAARKMGLVEASTRKKRAMQFGTQSARMERGAANGGTLLNIARQTEK